MSSETTNLKLVQPTVADIISVTAIAENMTTIDTFIGFMQVGTKESVAEPFSGLKVMESSGALWIYVDNAWVSLGGGGGGGAVGRKAYNTYTTNGSTTTTSELMSNIKTTFTSESGRRYWVEISAQIECVGTGIGLGSSVSCRLRWAAGASVTVSDTSMHTKPFSLQFQQLGTDPELIDFYCLGEFVPNVAGSVTVGLTYLNAYGGNVNTKASSTNPAIIIVRDVGT